MNSKEGTNQKNGLRERRKRLHLTLDEIAKLIGHVNPCHVHDWEIGSRKPSLDNALRLSVVLDCPIEILFLQRFNKIRSELHEIKIKTLKGRRD